MRQPVVRGVSVPPTDCTSLPIFIILILCGVMSACAGVVLIAVVVVDAAGSPTALVMARGIC
jgi:hypothetical protein